MFDGLNSHFSKNLILFARSWILRLTSLVSTVAGVRFVTTCSLEGGYQHWEETCWPSRRGWSAEAWRWRQYTLPKCLCPPSRLYNVTTQTTRHLTFLRTINLFLNNKFWCLFILKYSCFVIIKIPYEDIKIKETTLLWKWYSGFLEAYVLNAASLYTFASAIDPYSMTTRNITWKYENSICLSVWVYTSMYNEIFCMNVLDVCELYCLHLSILFYISISYLKES